MVDGIGGTGDTTLHRLIGAWMDEQMEETPTWATSLGIDGHDHELG